MSGALHVLCCRNFRPELEGAAAAEGWPDVRVAAFEARCGRPPIGWAELGPLLAEEDAEAVVLGGACLCALEVPPGRRAAIRVHRCGQCFELVAGAAQISEALARGAYLVTPGWLEGWRERLDDLGFTGTGAAALFREFARELVLLDTGVSPRSAARLGELARTLALPSGRVAVGLDVARHRLARLVGEWRLQVERRAATARDATRARERADLVATLDFVGRLVLLGSETEAVDGVADLFRMLFAPRRLHVVRVEGGTCDPAAPAGVRAEVEALQGDWAWTASGSGFLVRVAHGDETVAVVVVDGLAFPEYRDRYLDLARAVARVSGLAIRNARTYRRLSAAEESLRRSERSLRLAQAIAHVGHWELDGQGDGFTWSEETFRILGYAPDALAPSRDAFLRAIHPDDRAAVEAELRRAKEVGRFDLEYRVVLPGGAVRFIRGLGEVVRGPEMEPRLVGTVRDLAAPELLGVVQDITDRKELERRLAQEARTDALTGCANRRAFLEAAEAEFARVQRYGGDLSLLMLDLDHFKFINDDRGHPAGDEALREVARLCLGALRSQDVIARIGGEEFAVLLPETGPQEAAEVAERLRTALKEAEVRLPGGPPVRITTSVGVAALEAGDPGVEVVIQRADRALYDAKAAGRDRVVASVRPPRAQPA